MSLSQAPSNAPRISDAVAGSPGKRLHVGHCPARLVWPPALALLAALLAGVAPPARTAELTLVCERPGPAHERCAEAAATWAEANGHRVRVLAAPADPAQLLALYTDLFAVGAAMPDLLALDLVWLGVLAPHLLELTPILQGAEKEFMPVLIAASTIEGRLVALPSYLDFGLLYYRSDLLEAAGLSVPEDWSALEETAAVLQARGRADGNLLFWGFLWQGAQTEDLTANAIEWIGSRDGAEVVADDGTVAVDDARAAQAIEQAAAWIKRISPAAVLVHEEADSVARFAVGNGAFLRARTTAWAVLNAPDSPVRGKVGMAPLPRGGPDARHVGTVGGWQLAVSRYSAHPELAAELMLHLTGEDEQRRRVMEFGQIPTRTTLWFDAYALDAHPAIEVLRLSDFWLVQRPSAVTSAQYPEVSERLQKAVFAVLSGQRGAAEALADLRRQLDMLSQGGTAW